MKNSWRLSSDLIAFFPYSTSDRKQVYLASPEKKSYKAAVQKQIETTFEEISIESNEFYLKFDKNLDVFIKCLEFPDPNEYYLVNNLYKLGGYSENSMIGSIITQVQNNKGDFGDTVFEAIFSEESPGFVHFITPKMEEYKSAFEEMKRRMNCALNKRVKKWIPGHRYDTLSDTYYYLGEFVSRKKSDLCSEFLPDTDMIPVYLYVSNINELNTKISDVFKTNVFGTGEFDIKVLYNLPSAVESGEAIENDVTDIKDFYEVIIDNSISRYKTISDYGYQCYNCPKYIFDVTSIQSPSSLNYDTNSVKRLSEVVENLLFDLVFTYWELNKNRSDIFIGSSNDEASNVENLIRRFFQEFKDGNSMRNIYYTNLFETLEIDIDKIASGVIGNGNPENLVLSGDLENYLSYGSIYFKYHYTESSKKTVRQRVNSSNYKLETNTLSEVFGGFDRLKDEIKELADTAKNNYGIGVKYFYDTNVGSKKTPLVYTTLEIDVLDIIKHYGGIKNVPENLVNEIIKSKFWEVNIVIDKDGELK